MRIRAMRAADAPSVARINVKVWREAYRGLVPDVYLDRMSVAEKASAWKHDIESPLYGSSLRVCEDTHGGLCGYASAGPNRGGDSAFSAELYCVYVLPCCQLRGVGRALIADLVAALTVQRLHAMKVCVIAGNYGARRFYERLGARLVDTGYFTLDGQQIDEVTYGWPCIAELASSGLDSDDSDGS